MFKDLLQGAMVKVEQTQVKVRVGMETFWKAVVKDFSSLLPKIMPDVVKDVQVFEGDGGPGTVFLLNFVSDVASMSYQKEKLVDVDESLHQVGLEVVEGGHLNHGFSYYKVTYQLAPADGESETVTLVNIKVVYEIEAEETGMPKETLKSALVFVERLENYLLNECT